MPFKMFKLDSPVMCVCSDVKCTMRVKTVYIFIVYCKLQSTQLDRVISKFEVRKGREAGTIHRWFTAVVLLS